MLTHCNDATSETVVLTAGVGTTEQIALNGKTLDGNGKTITAIGDMMSNGKNTDPVILATSGVVKNLTIDGAGRGVGTRGALTGNLTVNNYAIGTANP